MRKDFERMGKGSIELIVHDMQQKHVDSGWGLAGDWRFKRGCMMCVGKRDCDDRELEGAHFKCSLNCCSMLIDVLNLRRGKQ